MSLTSVTSSYTRVKLERKGWARVAYDLGWRYEYICHCGDRSFTKHDLDVHQKKGLHSGNPVFARYNDMSTAKRIAGNYLGNSRRYKETKYTVRLNQSQLNGEVITIPRGETAKNAMERKRIWRPNIRRKRHRERRYGRREDC